jgi:hypothetical protein
MTIPEWLDESGTPISGDVASLYEWAANAVAEIDATVTALEARVAAIEQVFEPDDDFDFGFASDAPEIDPAGGVDGEDPDPYEGDIDG